MEPSWTDIVQAIAASVAIPGAIAAFIVLFKRDKNKEQELKSLAEIASQLTEMLNASENRYKDFKKPHMKIKLDSDSTDEMLTVVFNNINTQTTLKEYKAVEDKSKVKLQRQPVSNSAGKQWFCVQLTIKDPILDSTTLKMEYETEEGYFFTQTIFIWYDNGEYVILPREISDKTKSLSKNNISTNQF